DTRRLISHADRLGRDPHRIREADEHPGALPAEPLLVPEPGDLVARGGLPGDTPAHVLPGPVRIRRLARVRDVGPLRGIAGILVEINARDPVRVPLRARVDEVPDTILPD